MSLLNGPIGFVGLGIMGKGMVKNLATKLPNNLIVWNRSPGPAEELLSQFPGRIISVPTAANVVKQCQVTFCMLSNLEASLTVFDDEVNGIIAGISPGKVIIDCATLSPERLIQESKNIISKGGSFLEAPVSGSKVPAETGTLVFLCGGNKEIFEGVYPALQAMGKASFLFGDVGQGSKVKLVINMMLGNVMASLSEGMVLAKALNLPTNELLEVINQSALSSPMINGKAKSIVTENFSPHFPLKHAQKDMRLALELATEHGIDLPTTRTVNEQFIKGLEVYGDQDLSALYLTYTDTTNKEAI